MSRRIRLIVAYDGTNYVGWQLQENGVSVQQKLNEALLAVTGEQIRVHGSGRTDSGVHARAQVAHFDTFARMPADKFAIAMNMRLPRDIRVLFSEEAPEDFHARFSAKNKTYRYTVQTGLHADVFSRSTALHLHAPVDFEKMALAAEDALGEHDFCAFMTSGSKIESTVRTVKRSEWTHEGAFLFYDVSANGFLYNMVRILVGTMLEIGAGNLPAHAIAHALETKNRLDAGSTAPAQGLMLMRVVYDGFDTEEVLSRVNELFERFMREALEEASIAASEGEVPVGAVLVKDGAIVARAHNLCEQTHDATAHAELLCLRQGMELLGSRLSDCTLFVTLEPCAMCAGACVNAKLGRLVYGAFDETAGCCGTKMDLTDHCFLHSVETWGGVLEEECKELLSSFFKKLR